MTSFPNRFMNMGPKGQFLIKCDTQIFELLKFLIDVIPINHHLYMYTKRILVLRTVLVLTCLKD